MNIAIIDISGTVSEYSAYLTKSLSDTKDKETSVTLFCPKKTSLSDFSQKKLFSLVPPKYERSLSILKRGIKSVETIVNYSYLIIYSLFHRIDVYHFQWFPFLNVAGVEKYFFRAIKIIRPNCKIVYTHHNIFPHNISDNKIEPYRKRATDIFRLVDTIVVHTQTSKDETIREFGVPESKVAVCYHGIFYPIDGFEKTSKTNSKLQILMFGSQSLYKGTDVFVKAVSLLPKEDIEKISVQIIGRTDEKMLNECKELADIYKIKWVTVPVSNAELYQKIYSADCLVYPYRKISQSGALLLGLYFEKSIIVSDIPSFKETLEGFDSNWFFESENPQKMSELLSCYINGSIDVESQKKIINRLKIKYSWDEIAKHYFETVYQSFPL